MENDGQVTVPLYYWVRPEPFLEYSQDSFWPVILDFEEKRQRRIIIDLLVLPPIVDSYPGDSQWKGVRRRTIFEILSMTKILSQVKPSIYVGRPNWGDIYEADVLITIRINGHFFRVGIAAWRKWDLPRDQIHGDIVENLVLVNEAESKSWTLVSIVGREMRRINIFKEGVSRKAGGWSQILNKTSRA